MYYACMCVCVYVVCGNLWMYLRTCMMNLFVGCYSTPLKMGAWHFVENGSSLDTALDKKDTPPSRSCWCTAPFAPALLPTGASS